MKLSHVFTLTACAAAVGLSGCGGDSCPTETPQVQELADCTAQANTTVNFPVRLCPSCNQTAASCEVDLSAASEGIIQLDPVVEACDSANSCPPGCDVVPLTCSFTAPAQPGTYQVLVFDPGRNDTISRTLEVVASGPLSCSNI